MESFSKESTQTLSELLKRSITRMQGHLDELLQDVDTVCESLPPSPIVEEYKESDTFVAEPEPPVVEETIEEEEEEPVADESVTEESVFIEDEVSKPTVLGESIKLSAGGFIPFLTRVVWWRYRLDESCDRTNISHELLQDCCCISFLESRYERRK